MLEGSENVTPVEVKSGRVTRAKSLSVYMERYHPRQAYVLSARNAAAQNDRQGIPLYRAAELARNLNG